MFRDLSFASIEDEEDADNTSRTPDLANLTEEEKEKRKFHILTSIIIKKVVSHPEINKDLALYKDEQKSVNHVHSRHKIPLTSNNSNHSLISSTHSKSNHKLIHYTRSKNRMSINMNDSTQSADSLMSSSHSKNNLHDHTFGSRNKLRNSINSIHSFNSLTTSTHSQNIFVSSLSALSLSELKDRILKWNKEEVHILSGTCGICLCNFEKGEEICWSPNSQCKHTYHKECAFEWLMKHNDCPICRNDFLVLSDKDDIVDCKSSPVMPVVTCEEEEEEENDGDDIIDIPLHKIREDEMNMNDDVGLDLELETSRHSQVVNNSTIANPMISSPLFDSNFESSCDPINKKNNEFNIVCKEEKDNLFIDLQTHKEQKEDIQIDDVGLDIETGTGEKQDESDD